MPRIGGAGEPGGEAITKPPIFDNWPVALWCPWGPYRAVRWKYSRDDGDTLRFWISPGCGWYGWLDIRLRDVKAPEINSSDPVEKLHAYEARDHLDTLIPHLTQARVFTDRQLVSGGSTEDVSFERYVASVDTLAYLAVLDEVTKRPLPGQDGINAAQRNWLDALGYSGGM